MEKPLVVFIAFEEYDNLGVGYMAAVLSASGYETRIVAFNKPVEEILQTVKSLDPVLIGFSIIFQFYIDRFKDLVSCLRESGVSCHMTAGGQYASLRFTELFEIIPWLDSIVRFEGEYTLLELVKCVSSGKDWREINGIVYQNKGKVITNPLRPAEKDIDKFPYPVRSALTEYALDKKFATILAGRGCIHNCSFCNTNKFYQQIPGQVKRIRKPDQIVKEMAYLYYNEGCSVFLFQDDDFPVKSLQDPEWVNKFCNELKKAGIDDKIMWKINCRPDEIDEGKFVLMKNHGLYLVFLGIEDGTDIGLKRMDKNMTVGKCLEGINILRKLEIGFDYGFMLFQPETTYRSLNENLDFLRIICGDGYTSATFLKMLPFFETRVENDLKNEGRLKGRPGYLDYDFHDKSMNCYYDFITECYGEWMRRSDGLVNISKWARNYFSVYFRYFRITPEVPFLYQNIRRIISESNLWLLDSIKELSGVFESGHYETVEEEVMKEYVKNIHLRHNYYKEQINDTMRKLLRIAEVYNLTSAR